MPAESTSVSLGALRAAAWAGLALAVRASCRLHLTLPLCVRLLSAQVRIAALKKEEEGVQKDRERLEREKARGRASCLIAQLLSAHNSAAASVSHRVPPLNTPDRGLCRSAED